MIVARREAKAERIAHRPGQDQFVAPFASDALIARAANELEMAAGVIGADRDHAGGACLAEEQRLRPLQHLDLLHVERARRVGHALR